MTIEVEQIFSNEYQNEKLIEIAKSVNQVKEGYYTKTGFVKVGGGFGDNALFKDRTRQVNILLKGMPRRVRVHLLNSSTTTGLSGVKASIAATENLSSAPIPSGGVSAFVPFTFSSTTAPAASGSADANATPSALKSNWLDFTALPRNDGGKGYIVMLRLYQDATSSGTQMTIGNTVAMTDFEEYQVTCFYAQTNGDFTLTATTMTANANVQPFFLEVEYETNNCSVAIVGDSVMAGSNANPVAGAAASGAAFKAIKRLWQEKGIRVSLFNGAWSGASTTGGSGSTIPNPVRGYYGQFLAYLASGARPNIAAFCPWSVNNTLAYDFGQISAVTDISNRFISVCSEYGITPILVTPAPRNGITESQESVRRSCVNAIKSLCTTKKVKLIDRDDVYTNQSSPTGGYKLSEWCLDNVHPTEVGHSVESEVWFDVLDKMLT